jgi:hypothetical protein
MHELSLIFKQFSCATARQKTNFIIVMASHCLAESSLASKRMERAVLETGR